MAGGQGEGPLRVAVHLRCHQRSGVAGQVLRLHPRVVIEYGPAGYSAAGIWSGRAIEGHGLGSLSFFKQPAGITIGDIVAMTGAEPRGVAPLDRRHRRYRLARPRAPVRPDVPRQPQACRRARLDARCRLLDDRAIRNSRAGRGHCAGGEGSDARLHRRGAAPASGLASPIVFVRRRRCGAGRIPCTRPPRSRMA